MELWGLREMDNFNFIRYCQIAKESSLSIPSEICKDFVCSTVSTILDITRPKKKIANLVDNVLLLLFFISVKSNNVKYLLRIY